MRALLDTNLIISYLLTPNQKGTLSTLVEALFAQKFTFLLPEALLDEILETVTRKPDVRARISVEKLQETIALLQSVAVPIESITQPIPQVSRDPKDDYLLAYAVVGQADYLVTGDNDLLTLKQIEGVAILPLADFVKLL